MKFTAKVFEPNGCQRESKHNSTGLQKSKQNVNKYDIQHLYALQEHLTYHHTPHEQFSK